MAYDPAIHHRTSVRLRDYDYSQPGNYFITICTACRACLFGEMIGSEMRLNEIGQMIRDEWLRSGGIRPELRLDEWVIMPNHLHGIVGITGMLTADPSTGISSPVGTHGRASPQRKPRSLSSFAAGFKSAATARVNQWRCTPGLPIWQERFHDHIIRNDYSLDRIREYIFTNPQRWAQDRENPGGDGTDDMDLFLEQLDQHPPAAQAGTHCRASLPTSPRGKPR